MHRTKTASTDRSSREPELRLQRAGTNFVNGLRQPLVPGPDRCGVHTNHCGSWCEEMCVITERSVASGVVRRDPYHPLSLWLDMLGEVVILKTQPLLLPGLQSTPLGRRLSVTPECFHGVDARGPAGGDECCESACSEKYARDHDER